MIRIKQAVVLLRRFYADLRGGGWIVCAENYHRFCSGANYVFCCPLDFSSLMTVVWNLGEECNQ